VALEAGYWQRYICKAMLYWRTRKIGFEAWLRRKRGAGGRQSNFEPNGFIWRLGNCV
jgi:hypothetical protein